jgi:hypothetical protein
MKTKEFLSDVMRLAWQFVKRNGFTMSRALKVAWANAKLRIAMKLQIAKLCFH